MSGSLEAERGEPKGGAAVLAPRAPGAIMVYHSLSLTRRTSGSLPKCRLIVRCDAGHDNVVGSLARERGIPAANVPGYGAEAAADSALGLMPALAPGAGRLSSVFHGGAGGGTYEHAAPPRRLHGGVFGILGLGRIATAAGVRRRAGRRFPEMHIKGARACRQERLGLPARNAVNEGEVTCSTER